MDRYENNHCEIDLGRVENVGAEHCADLVPGASAPAPSALNDAFKLIEFLGPDAQRTVATAATAQFGDWLGWPLWLTRGTALPPGEPLPGRVTLADDLIIIANIVDQGEADPIIARLFGEFKIPGAPITVPALYNAPTLQDALDFFLRTAASGTPFLKIELQKDQDRFSIILDSRLSPGPLRDFCTIAIMSTAYRFVSFFITSDTTDIAIELEATEDSAMAGPVLRLPSRIACDAPRYAIHGSTAWLPIKNVRSDSAFWNFALERMAAAEREGTRSDIARRIRTAICAAMEIDGRVPRLKQIAALEGVSERTLVRTLAAQGIKFHQLVEEERRMKAAELIGNSTVSLTEIARLLGFTDMSSFGRSYRQWFGITPGQARSRRNA